MTEKSSFDINPNSNPVQTVAQLKEDKNMLRATDKITALYCRLSVEDTKDEKKNGKEDLSNSIQNQKAMLLQYARDNRFPSPTFFIDATVIIGLKQNPTIGRRFSPIFSFIEHLSGKYGRCYT